MFLAYACLDYFIEPSFFSADVAAPSILSQAPCRPQSAAWHHIPDGLWPLCGWRRCEQSTWCYSWTSHCSSSTCSRSPHWPGSFGATSRFAVCDRAGSRYPDICPCSLLWYDIWTDRKENPWPQVLQVHLVMLQNSSLQILHVADLLVDQVLLVVAAVQVAPDLVLLFMTKPWCQCSLLRCERWPGRK